MQASRQLVWSNEAMVITYLYGYVFGLTIALRRGDRAAEGTCLENKRGESHRGFKSHPLHDMSNKEKEYEKALMMIAEAVLNEGANPVFHKRSDDKLRTGWPVLWRAVHYATDVYQENKDA